MLAHTHHRHSRPPAARGVAAPPARLGAAPARPRTRGAPGPLAHQNQSCDRTPSFTVSDLDQQYPRGNISISTRVVETHVGEPFFFFWRTRSAADTGGSVRTSKHAQKRVYDSTLKAKLSLFFLMAAGANGGSSARARARSGARGCWRHTRRSRRRERARRAPAFPARPTSFPVARCCGRCTARRRRLAPPARLAGAASRAQRWRAASQGQSEVGAATMAGQEVRARARALALSRMRC